MKIISGFKISAKNPSSCHNDSALMEEAISFNHYRLIKAINYFLILFLVFLPASLYAQDDTTMYKISVTKYLMGTTVETTARSTDVNFCKQALLAAYEEMQRVENLLSFQKDSSEISGINRQAGIQPVKVSIETLDMLKRAKAFSKKYNGVFDVTIGALSDLWGFSEDKEIILPEDKTIKELTKLVNYDDIVINESDTTVFLKEQRHVIRFRWNSKRICN